VQVWKDGTWYEIVVSGTISTNTWYHLNVVYRDSGSDYYVYLDGNLVSTFSAATPSDSSGSTLGANNGGGSPYFDGIIDDLRIYNRALSEPEIQALYELGRVQGRREPVTEPVAADAQVARYALDGNVDDSWGSNNGTNNGVSFVDGIHGQAGEFQASNSEYVNCGAIGTRTKFTASLWFDASSWSTSDGNWDYFVSRENSSDYDGPWFLRHNGDSSVGLEFGVADDSGNQYDIKTGIRPNTSVWKHFVGSYDGSKMRLYFDGELIGENSVSVTLSTQNNELIIGSNGGNQRFFDGLIDDVRIYDRALTPLEIEKLFHRGFHRIQRRYTT
jgi:hypothetical protein